MLDASRHIASQGKCHSRMIISVSSNEPEVCISEFVSLEKAITSNIETLKEIYFYELLAEIEIKFDVDLLKFSKNILP